MVGTISKGTIWKSSSGTTLEWLVDRHVGDVVSIDMVLINGAHPYPDARSPWGEFFTGESPGWILRSDVEVTHGQQEVLSLNSTLR